MNRLRTRRGRRAASLASGGLFVVLPLVAYFAAPSASADNSPAANLGGLNATSYGTAIQFEPLVKGLVPAGNLATGDFFQISIPYAQTSSQTGPSSAAVATPVYPGPVAASLSGGLALLGFPPALAKLFVDPVLAQAAYPPQPGMNATGNYSPPEGTTTGVGTASTSADVGGSKAESVLSNTPLAGGLITIGTASNNSSTTIGASSVSDVAHADLTHISIDHGLVDIASISSDSSATSNGSVGTETSTLKIGAVTVAGQPAYIGPDGLHLAKTSNSLENLTGVLNQVLVALQQAGLSITTVNPSSTVQGAQASVDSGVVQIGFQDQSIPSPDGEVPVTSAGVLIDLGLTHADAQATALPAIPSFNSSSPPNFSSPGSQSLSGNTGSTGTGSSTVINTNNTGGSGSQPATAQLPSQSNGSLVTQPAAFIGVPTRMAWVVIAVILSIVASGPLLGYANWQLLRGRKT